MAGGRNQGPLHHIVVWGAGFFAVTFLAVVWGSIFLDLFDF